MVGGGAALGGIAMVGGLGLLGFGAAGVGAGTTAAAIQTAVYGAAVPAGSAFAIVQSISMTAVAAKVGSVAGAAASTAGYIWWKK